MSRSLALKAGALVTLSSFLPADFDIPLARQVYERSISFNTTAAGGNASLMLL